MLRRGVSLLSRRTIPPASLGIILRNTPAVRVHDPEAVLRDGESLLGRGAIPRDRLHIVLRDTSALLIHGPEVELCRSVPLEGREPKPPHGLGIVLGDALAVRIHDPEAILRLRVALPSQRTHFIERQVGDQLLRLDAFTGTERTGADQDEGSGDDACVVNRHASPSRSHD